MINVKNVGKDFLVKKKEEGFRKSLKYIFKPQYLEINAVKGVSFFIEEGERVAFIGPNGAGKSTMIKMLTGILTPTSGKILVNGWNPQKDRRKIAKCIGTVFGQKEQLWMNLTPYDNFIYLSLVYSINRDRAEKRIMELSKIFALKEIMDVPLKKLSLGQRMKCEIVAGIIHNPQILFLDEPTIGLDIVAKKDILDLIKRMNREYNTTIFFTSHDILDVEKLCERVIIVNEGQIVVDDSIKKIKKTFFRKKIIEVLFSEEFDENILSEYDFVKHGKGQYVFTVDSQGFEIEAIIKKMDISKIRDINIQDTPLELIIGDIYNITKGADRC
ncbi:MAG: ATP-binding cassette domain-containing protein [Lachnospiraceae bacterium]|jgi:ABC-2 type transport system ATP-binding protein|nr:ATP-binding cassette domain-containing protein [Lachnospiraceae bacterium]